MTSKSLKLLYKTFFRSFFLLIFTPISFVIIVHFLKKIDCLPNSYTTLSLLYSCFALIISFTIASATSYMIDVYQLKEHSDFLEQGAKVTFKLLFASCIFFFVTYIYTAGIAIVISYLFSPSDIGLGITLLMNCIIILIIAPLLTFVVAMIVENLGPIKCFARSRELSQHKRTKVFLCYFVPWIAFHIVSELTKSHSQFPKVIASPEFLFSSAGLVSLGLVALDMVFVLLYLSTSVVLYYDLSNDY